MTSLENDLSLAVARECSLLQFREDHEAKNERLDDVIMAEVKRAKKRVAQLRKAAAEEAAKIDAEIAQLEARKAEVINGAEDTVRAQQRRIAQCRAYLSAGE